MIHEDDFGVDDKAPTVDVPDTRSPTASGGGSAGGEREDRASAADRDYGHEMVQAVTTLSSKVATLTDTMAALTQAIVATHTAIQREIEPAAASSAARSNVAAPQESRDGGITIAMPPAVAPPSAYATAPTPTAPAGSTNTYIGNGGSGSAPASSRRRRSSGCGAAQASQQCTFPGIIPVAVPDAYGCSGMPTYGCSDITQPIDPVPIGEFDPARDIGCGACVAVVGERSAHRSTIMLRVLEALVERHASSVVVAAGAGPPTASHLSAHADKIVWHFDPAMLAHLLVLHQMQLLPVASTATSKHVLIVIDDLTHQQLSPAAASALLRFVTERVALRVTVVFVIERPLTNTLRALNSAMDVALFTDGTDAHAFIQQQLALEFVRHPTYQQLRAIPPNGAIAIDLRASTFAFYQPEPLWATPPPLPPSPAFGAREHDSHMPL